MQIIKEIKKPTGRRRPKEAQRKAILDAAASAFFESGFEGTSVDAIIKRVGGSKRAVYANFGSKRDLFVAIFRENVEQAVAILESEELRGHDLRSTLEEFARRLLQLLMSPTTVLLFSLAIGEARRFPKLATDFFESGPDRVMLQLARELQLYKDRGEITVSDCHDAAEYFIGMLRGNLQIGVFLGARKAPGARDIERIAGDVVEIFLKGILCADSGATLATQHAPTTA